MPDNVRCQGCGLLAIPNRQTGTLDEISRELREQWRFPEDIRKDAYPSTLLANCPQCTADSCVVREGFREDVEHEYRPSVFGFPVQFENGVTDVLARDRRCDSFIEWQPCLSPKEHKRGELSKRQEETNTAHSADFTSVKWFGTSYTFAKGLQAESVRVLWGAWENKTPSLSEKHIGESAGSAADRFRLEHIFKPTNKETGKRETHPAWGTMIKSIGKGTFALSPP
jgi:hypothetical protein